MLFDDSLSNLLAKANRMVQVRLAESLATEGAQLIDWRILSCLLDRKGHAMGELAERLDINPPTLTKAVDRMVSNGLAMRNYDYEDTRRVLLYATDDGLNLEKRLAKLVRDHEKSLVEALGPAKAKELNALLTMLETQSELRS